MEQRNQRAKHDGKGASISIPHSRSSRSKQRRERRRQQQTLTPTPTVASSSAAATVTAEQTTAAAAAASCRSLGGAKLHGQGLDVLEVQRSGLAACRERHFTGHRRGHVRVTVPETATTETGDRSRDFSVGQCTKTGLDARHGN